MLVDTLGDRQKLYESAASQVLTVRTPVVIRLDGKAFHTYTKGFKRPFDVRILKCMVSAAKETSKSIQGFKIGYVQSDEATFVLTDTDSLDMQPWFGYKINKMISIAASTMTANFMVAMSKEQFSDEEIKAGLKDRIALFDGRAFNVPFDDVSNNLLWRARDWNRNSVNMYAQSIFGHKDLQGLNLDAVKEKLFNAGHDWEKLPSVVKYGTFILGKPSQIRTDVQPSFTEVHKCFMESFKYLNEKES